MLKRLCGLFILLSLVFATNVFAQGAPDQINDALAALSTQLGLATPLTLNDLDNWTWGQDDYPDTSLGCPQPGQTYAQVITVAYEFDLTLGGNIYDYRVAADRSIIFLCSITPLAEVTEAPLGGGDPEDSNPLCPVPPPTGIVYPPTRLTVGIQGRVTPGLPNNVRSEPNSNAALTGEIPGGAVFTILAGPQCDETGVIWWQVDSDGLVGWTAEISAGQYFIEPAPGAVLPTDLPVLSVENAPRLVELSRLQGNFVPDLGWSYSSETDAPPQLIALGGLGAGGAWVYNTSTLDLTPRIIEPNTLLTAVVFGPDPFLPLFGSDNGSIRLWDIASNAPLVERAFLQSQADPVSAIAFSSDGTTLAAAGGRAILQQDVPENQFAISMWDVASVSQKSVGLRGHTAEVTSLIFNADNTTLYSGALDNTIRIWNTTDGSSTSVEMPAGVNAMQLSADGVSLVVAVADGTIQILDLASSIASPFAQDSSAVTSVAISPDGTLIASANTEGIVRVWDVAERAELIALQGHNGIVETVSFSPDGKFLASLGEDNTIRIWSVPTSVG